MDDFFSYDVVNWGKPFERNEQVKKDPVGNEVLIKITASGLCHSDIHIRKGFFDLVAAVRKIPKVIGYEDKEILDIEIPIAKKLRYWES